MHVTVVPATDVLLICAAVAFLAIMAITVVNANSPGWDVRVLTWFSDVASTPAWSVSWWLIVLSWMAIRFVLFEHYAWYRMWGDNVLITVLFAACPYVVENAMKFSTKRQMTSIENILELVLDISTSNRNLAERAEKRDRAMFDLISKLCDALEVKEEA